METIDVEVSRQTVEYDRERRLYDDTTTWLAEMLEGSMRTPFEYRFDGRELYGSDGSPLGEIFDDAIVEALRLPSSLAFELRRRRIEKQEYQDMVEMMRSDSYDAMVVVSDFPAELMAATRDVGGYNVGRKTTMLRVLTKTNDGRMIMQSQSLDQSDRAALEAMYFALGFIPAEGELLGQRMLLKTGEAPNEFLIDQLTGVYDRALAERYGGSWYAGRQTDHSINTYEFVCEQHDLLGLYTETAQKFGDNPGFLRDIAATIQKRYTAASSTALTAGLNERMPCTISLTELMNEIVKAGREADRAGRSFSGCGLTLGAENIPTQEQLGQAGYGNKSEEDKYGSLKFKCQRGHTNKRPRNKLLEKCKKCGISVRC